MATSVQRIVFKGRAVSANARRPSTVHRSSANRVNVGSRWSQRIQKHRVAVVLVTIACPQVRDRIKRRVVSRSIVRSGTKLIQSVALFSIEDSRESEPCPENSVLTEDGKCECAPCPRPTCQPGHRPVQVRAALDRETPGSCCPLYECKPAGNRFKYVRLSLAVTNSKNSRIFDRSIDHW